MWAIAARRSPLRFVCDPVLGDNGRLYVPEAVVEALNVSLQLFRVSVLRSTMRLQSMSSRGTLFFLLFHNFPIFWDLRQVDRIAESLTEVFMTWTIERLGLSCSDTLRTSFVTDIMAKWDVAPYPACPLERLLQMQLIWVATPHPQTDACESKTSDAVSHDAAKDAAGAVGVVVCPLSGLQLEAYLQYVFVHPEHRRKGLATAMLRRVLTDLLGTPNSLPEVSAPPVASRRSLRRIRLHTMHGDTEECKATISMYEQLGFVVRKHCPRYYDNGCDAVEMVFDTFDRRRSPLPNDTKKRDRE